MKNNQYITGSAHQRIYASLAENMPITDKAGAAISKGALGKAAIPLLPAAVEADVLLNIASKGVEYIEKMQPINNTINATRWGFGKIFGLGSNVFNRLGGFMYRGTLQQFAYPVGRTLASTAASLANWAKKVPSDVLSLPSTIIKGTTGLGLGVAALPFKLAGALPDKLLGWGWISNIGKKMGGVGDDYRNGFFKPLENSVNTVADITNAGVNGVLDSGEANLSAWSKLVANGKFDGEITTVRANIGERFKNFLDGFRMGGAQAQAA